MDNATHSLFGLLIAEVAIRAHERKRRTSTTPFRTHIRWVSVLGNNLPDFDVLYANHYGAELGYILHHRGHTHTWLMGALLGLALFVCWIIACTWRGRSLSRRERYTLFGLSLLSPWVHLALDALNNYGVHPFWPQSAQWVYGDSLFIIEPWLWVVLVPALVFGLSNRWLRGALWSVMALGGVLAWVLEMVPWVVALALTIGGIASISYSARVGSERRLYYALGGTSAGIVVFALGSRLAEAHTRAWAQLEPRLLDVVVTPSPGNPLCFGIITVTLDGDRYVARAGSLSLLPSVVSPPSCRVQPTGLTVGLQAARAPDTEELAWEGEWRGSAAELRRLAQTHCHVGAWLRFARVPVWSRLSDSRLLLADLRFDRDVGIDFDEFFVRVPPTQCPSWVPGWTPPRQDLIAPALADPTP